MTSFNIPYFLFQYSKHNEVKEKLITAIHNEDGVAVDDKDKISKTDWYVNKDWQNKEYINILVNNEFIQDIHRALQDKSIGNWKLISLWYQLYKTNDTHNWHKHGECQWSFVYYLKLPEKARGTVLEDMITKEHIDLEQKEGDIFIFPSMMKHCSPVNYDDEEKIIISGNLDYDGKGYE
jgi:hypothetical protein